MSVIETRQTQTRVPFPAVTDFEVVHTPTSVVLLCNRRSGARLLLCDGLSCGALSNFTFSDLLLILPHGMGNDEV